MNKLCSSTYVEDFFETGSESSSMKFVWTNKYKGPAGTQLTISECQLLDGGHNFSAAKTCQLEKDF